MWGHLAGEHLQQSSGYQLPNILATLFPLLNGFVVLSWPIPHGQALRTTLHAVWDELQALLPGLGLDIQLNCHLQDDVGVTGHDTLQVGRCTGCDGLHHSHNSRELGQGQGAASRTYKKLGHGRCSSTGSRMGCEINSSCSLDLPAPTKALHFSCSTQKQEEMLHLDSHMG